MTPWFMNFSFDGRARRSHAWANYFIWLSIIAVLFIALAVTESAHAVAAVLIVTLALLAAGACGFVDQWATIFRRAHDTNKSGWIFLLLLVPIVNLVGLYWLLIEDSNAGPNKYGPPVKQFYSPQGPTYVAP